MPCKYGEVTAIGDSFLTKVSPVVSISANGGVIVESDQQVHAQSSALSEILTSSAEALYLGQHVGHLVPTLVTTPGCNIGSSIVMFAFRMMHVHFMHKKCTLLTK